MAAGHARQSQLALVLESVVNGKAIAIAVAFLIEAPVEVLDAGKASRQDQATAIDRIGIDKAQ